MTPPTAPRSSPPQTGATPEERARIDAALGAATRAEALVEQLEHRVEVAEGDVRRLQADARDEARRELADSRAELATATGQHRAVEVAEKARRWDVVKLTAPLILSAIGGALASQWHRLIDWLGLAPKGH